MNVEAENGPIGFGARPRGPVYVVGAFLADVLRVGTAPRNPAREHLPHDSQIAGADVE
jgi:hypothetical protein